MAISNSVPRNTWPERRRETLRRVRLLAIVRVAHRRSYLRVAEPGLELDYRLGAADCERNERVAQIVEADGPQAGSLLRGLESTAQRRAVQVL